MKDAIEDFLDRTIGKPARKALEQVAHAVMGALAGSVLCAIWLGVERVFGFTAAGVYLPAAIAGALIAGTLREYWQNVGDAPDHETLFVVADVPINSDLLVDLLAFLIGGGVAGGIWLAFAIGT